MVPGKSMNESADALHAQLVPEKLREETESFQMKTN